MNFRKVDGLPPHIAERIAPHVPGKEWIRLAHEIKTGVAELFEVNDGESVAVTRIEDDIAELVICAYEGKNVRDFAKAMIRAAKANDLTSVRFHTVRDGMARLLREVGPVEVERVYTVTL